MILYIGKLGDGQTSYSRMIGLKKNGHNIKKIDTTYYLYPNNPLMRKFQNYFHYGIRINSLNREVLKNVKKYNPNMIWIDKGNLIQKETLYKIRSIQKPPMIIHYNTDDIKYKNHGFKEYLDSLDLYDVHITTNRFNYEELKSLTSKQIILSEIGYDSELFFPGITKSKISNRVIFVGHYEREYFKYLGNLMNNEVEIELHGSGWNLKLPPSKRKYLKSYGLWGRRYANLLRSSNIGIGLYSTLNRNHTSGRIFEIPACNTMLVAKRNEILENLYKEDVEAIFFDCKEELFDKVVFYKKNDTLGNQIAKQGYLRLQNNKCSWTDRITDILKELS